MPTAGDSTSNAPAYDIVAVTQSDATNDPNGPFRGLLITGVGAVKLTLASGNAVTLASGALAAGVIHPIRFKRIWSTGTTATGIWGCK